MKSVNTLSLVKTIIVHVIGRRVLRRPIVFFRFRCSILILLKEIVRCGIRSL
jgi:hypothetical protein